jgi:quinol monooxygenase YgiN
MILVIGSVVAKEGYLSEALTLSQEHVARSKTEQGCISHAVYDDTDNPQRLVFVEQWASREALFEHFKVPASRNFVKALTELSAGEPSITAYEAKQIELPGKKAK